MGRHQNILESREEFVLPFPSIWISCFNALHKDSHFYGVTSINVYRKRCAAGWVFFLFPSSSSTSEGVKNTEGGATNFRFLCCFPADGGRRSSSCCSWTLAASGSRDSFTDLVGFASSKGTHSSGILKNIKNYLNSINIFLEKIKKNKRGNHKIWIFPSNLTVVKFSSFLQKLFHDKKRKTSLTLQEIINELLTKQKKVNYVWGQNI